MEEGLYSRMLVWRVDLGKQVPCVAIRAAVHEHLRAASDLLVVIVPVMGVVHRRYWVDRVLDVSRISGW